jgi:hypothetical protein
MHPHSRAITISLSLVFLLFTVSPTQAQNRTIPQIADGGGWQTTLVLTNTGSSATAGSLTFYKESGGGATQSWNLTLLENVSIQSLSLPLGGTLFLRTQATNPTTSVGWALLQASPDVVVYSIFTFRTLGQPDQEGTAPAAAGARRILVPFDNTPAFKQRSR